MQIPQAFDYLKRFEGHTAEHIPFQIALTNKNRGIYLRNSVESERPTTFQIKIIPEFHPECDNQEVVSFEMDVVLSSSVPWVRTPKQFVLNGQGGVHASKGFEVMVDAPDSALAHGAHFGLIQGVDATAPDRGDVSVLSDRLSWCIVKFICAGPIFHMPVTVIKPQKVPNDGDFRIKVQCLINMPSLFRTFEFEERSRILTDSEKDLLTWSD